MADQNKYVRMLDKRNRPSFDDLLRYCGESGNIWVKLNSHIEKEYRASGLIHFPYGKDGWCVRYKRKNRPICDIFAENGAFTMQIRIPNEAMDAIYSGLSEYAQEAWNNRCPCRNGRESWIHFRAISNEHFGDISRIIRAKLTSRVKNRITNAGSFN